MLFTCALGMLLLSLSSAVAVLAGFGVGEIVGAEAVFMLALVSAGSAVILIVLDLLLALVSISARSETSDYAEERMDDVPAPR